MKTLFSHHLSINEVPTPHRAVFRPRQRFSLSVDKLRLQHGRVRGRRAGECVSAVVKNPGAEFSYILGGSQNNVV
jgi:hypothetical protein